MIKDKNIACLACGDSKSKKEYVVQEKMFGLGHHFTYLECTNCGSIQIDEVPENLAFYYSSGYYTSTGLVLSSLPKNIYKKIRWHLYKRGFLSFNKTEFLAWLKPLNLNLGDKIADIGCGNGQLLYEMHCSGFNNLYGYDPFLHKEISLNGLRVSQSNMEDIVGKFDVIMLHHSFEHMEKPKDIFKKLSFLLKPKGKLLIRVPVTDAEVWKTETVNWFQLDAPRHLYIPSVKAMRLLGENNGLTLDKVIFDSNEKQFVITDMFKNGIPLKGNESIDHIDDRTKKILLKKAEKLNVLQKGDQACFYFHKI